MQNLGGEKFGYASYRYVFLRSHARAQSSVRINTPDSGGLTKDLLHMQVRYLIN